MPDDLSQDDLAKQAGSLIQALCSTIDDLGSVQGEITHPHVLADLLASLRDHRLAVNRVYDEIEQAYITTAGEKKLEVAGVGVVEIKSSVRRTKWDHASLWKVVVARALDERQIDPETGELLEREAETVARVLSECMSPSWRVTALRDRGIDETEFCQVDEQAWGVKLPPRDVAA